MSIEQSTKVDKESIQPEPKKAGDVETEVPSGSHKQSSNMSLQLSAKVMGQTGPIQPDANTGHQKVR